MSKGLSCPGLPGCSIAVGYHGYRRGWGTGLTSRPAQRVSGFSSSRPRFFPLFFCRHHSRVISKTPPSALKRNESDAGPGASRGMARPRAGAPPTTFQGETALQQPRSSQARREWKYGESQKRGRAAPGPPRCCRAQRGPSRPEAAEEQGEAARSPRARGRRAGLGGQRWKGPELRRRCRPEPLRAAAQASSPGPPPRGCGGNGAGGFQNVSSQVFLRTRFAGFISLDEEGRGFGSGAISALLA